MELKEKRIFDKRYRLTRILGSGGFSEVWLAEDMKVSNQRKALKVYAPGKGLDADGVQLFSKEFELVFDLNHANLLRPAHFDVCDRSPYLVLPYCEQGSAAKLVGKISEEEAWRFLHDVAMGLAYLHEQEPPIIHQDIKPDNVLIDNRGNYLITDFGISAKARSTLRKSMGNVKSGGTIAYMAPERFGKDNTPIKASDIWSLGATLFELLTGDAPFGEHGGVLQKSGADVPDLTGNWSPELKEIVTLCLLKETWDRPTALQLVESTEKYLKEKKITIKPEQQPENVPKTKKERDTQGKPVPDGDSRKEAPVIPNEKSDTKPAPLTWYKNKAVLTIACIVLIIAAIFLIVQKGFEDKSSKHIETSSANQMSQPTGADNKIQTDSNTAFVEPEMVLVRGGTFTMGCTSELGYDCYNDEKPAHQVTVSDFQIGIYEVTQAQWQAVMGSNPSNFKGDNLPVENVSWNDVQEFIRTLNDRTNKQYRLPTEAEWEFAASGGNNSKGYTYSGSDNLSVVAWYRDNSEDKTHPVGTKSPNELGIYDMSGNVREWCSDWYDSYNSNAQTDPKGPSSRSHRVVRGGSWDHFARQVRVSYRNSIAPDYRTDHLGFRLACSSK